MATTNSLEPDPDNQIISVATNEVGGVVNSAEVPPAGSMAELTPNQDTPLPSDEFGEMGAVDEVEIWKGRYSFGNFAGRFMIGAALILGCLYLIYEAQSRHSATLRPLIILLGITTTGFWIWLGFRIIRARISHHYRLTSHRLFVSSGIFHRRQDMLELEHLKEVSIQQSHFLSHLFRIATVVVTSNVNGAPVLYLVGIKEAQKVVDLLYFHARK